MLAFCHAVVSGTSCVTDPRLAPALLYSVTRSLSVAPAVSPRTHTDAVYRVPTAGVSLTQFGASLSVHVPEVPAVASFADPVPVWPPSTRTSVTPVLEPDVFQPLVPDSKPGLPTTLALTVTGELAAPVCPAVSVTVTVTT